MPDWSKIREGYEVGESYRALSREHKVSHVAIRKRSIDDGWTRLPVTRGNQGEGGNQGGNQEGGNQRGNQASGPTHVAQREQFDPNVVKMPQPKDSGAIWSQRLGRFVSRVIDGRFTCEFCGYRSEDLSEHRCRGRDQRRQRANQSPKRTPAMLGDNVEISEPGRSASIWAVTERRIRAEWKRRQRRMRKNREYTGLAKPLEKRLADARRYHIRDYGPIT